MNRFFIIGNPRSGTTLFRLMMNKHSRISVPPEAGFLVWLNSSFNYFQIMDIPLLIEALKNTKKIESWNLDYETLQDYMQKKKPNSFPDAIDVIYEYYSSNVLQKKVDVFGDKNNYYLNHIDLLACLYPDAKFIHIIRDGRSVAASYQSLMTKSIDSAYAPKLPTNITEIAEEWMHNINHIQDSLAALPLENWTSIRFEDLVLYPEKILGNVCKFLNLDFEKQMLEYYQTDESSGLEPVEYLAWKSKNLQPLQFEEVDKYKLLNADDLNKFEVIAAEMLKKYHYIN